MSLMCKCIVVARCRAKNGSSVHHAMFKQLRRGGDNRGDIRGMLVGDKVGRVGFAQLRPQHYHCKYPNTLHSKHEAYLLLVLCRSSARPTATRATNSWAVPGANSAPL